MWSNDIKRSQNLSILFPIQCLNGRLWRDTDSLLHSTLVTWAWDTCAQIYKVLYGDAMLVPIRISTNMADENQQKYLLPSFATKKQGTNKH